jgi:G:T-mismatch repair DNA endonuclease (very short patch repair protein)
MSELYTRTIQKEENLKQLGYNVIAKWECDYVTNADAEVSNIIKM